MPLPGRSMRLRRLRRTPVLLWVLLLAIATTGCSGSDRTENGAPPVEPGCSVTRLEDRRQDPPEALVSDARGDSAFYGHDGLWVSLPRPGVRAEPWPDGSFSLKIGWWRLRDGALRVSAQRVDGPGSARAEIPGGYGTRGFQPSGIAFSHLGCWRVTGALAETDLTLTVEVRA